MNRLERAVYDVVKHHPRLKLTIRDLYQSVFDLLPQPPAESAYEITAREGYFFGFHDHTPFSPDGSMLLANRYSIPLRMPSVDDELEVGVFDGEGFLSFRPITTTRAWNWHMGCRLQWRGPHDQIVLNDHRDGRDVGRVVDAETRKETWLQAPVGTVSPDGRWAVGYSFARVERCMPGYGYQHPVDDVEAEVKAPEGHGIHRIDLDTGESRMLFSIADIATVEPEGTMRDGFHFFSHTVFSPDSRRVLFLHRWIHGDVTKRWSRMISCNVDGREIHVFPTSGMASHIGWRGPEHVIAYSRVAGVGDCYAVFRDRVQTGVEVLGQGLFSSDGHPSFEPGGRWMVTDTYPDRRRRQTLVLFDAREGRRYDLASLPSPSRFKSSKPHLHWSCDLHPRWSRDGSFICFDSAHTGRRSLCTIELGRELDPGQLKWLSHAPVLSGRGAGS